MALVSNFIFILLLWALGFSPFAEGSAPACKTHTTSVTTTKRATRTITRTTTVTSTSTVSSVPKRFFIQVQPGSGSPVDGQWLTGSNSGGSDEATFSADKGSATIYTLNSKQQLVDTANNEIANISPDFQSSVLFFDTQATIQNAGFVPAACGISTPGLGLYCRDQTTSVFYTYESVQQLRIRDPSTPCTATCYTLYLKVVSASPP